MENFQLTITDPFPYRSMIGRGFCSATFTNHSTFGNMSNKLANFTNDTTPGNHLDCELGGFQWMRGCASIAVKSDLHVVLRPRRIM